ncbi:hypothetical protein BD413DRAFT_604897 [Trametes elegans]|nr:hypothetical protein BD413DRAFT_604897 [Trametes elegans]
MARSRRVFYPSIYQCPHCIRPRKFCKNLSGLTQHINTVHIDIFRAPSPPYSPSPTPSCNLSPAHDNFAVPLGTREVQTGSRGPQSQWSNDNTILEGVEEVDEEGGVGVQHGGVLREDHPVVSGKPCDEAGCYILPAGTAPPPRTSATPDDWSPFGTRLEFELAEFLYKREQMSARNITTLMSLWAAYALQHGIQPPFADHADLYATIDSIALGDVPWGCLRARYHGPRPETDVPSWMDDAYEVWYRDPRQIALHMLANPDFAGEIDYAPYREFTGSGDRRYTHYMSGNWAWRQANLIARELGPEADGAMFMPILLGSDKTTVSVATGQNDYYPLYLSIGNIHNNVRRAHRDSVILIAFLAIPKVERKYTDSPSFRKFRRQLLHSSISAILCPFRPGMTTPEVVRCPDAHFRRAIWGIGAYIADYIEQVVVSCIVQGWCPTCLKYPGQLDTPEEGERRSRSHTEALIRTFEPGVLWDDYGVIHDLVPFTNDFPRADIYELLSGDLLHQLIKGTFKDHLVAWVGDYLTLQFGDARGKELLDEIDRRIALVPPFPGLRHFKQGRDFKQWTGDDSKALMKVYLPPIAGILPPRIVKTFASFLEVCYIARKESLTESDLRDFDQARRDFNHHREIFRESGVRPDGFSLPRQHSLEHYLQHIRNFGAPNGLCTSITEAKHIKAVKEPWRRSNRYEPLGQMLLTNQRLDKLAAARADFEARGMLSGTCFDTVMAVLHTRAGADDKEHTSEDIVQGPRVSGFVVLPCKHRESSSLAISVERGYPQTVQELSQHLNIPHLSTLLARFLFQQAHPGDTLPGDQDLDMWQRPDSRVRVYHSAVATFYAPSDPSGVGGMHREHIRATPSWRKGPPRYDCVFVGKDPSATGLQSLHVARVRLFFSVLASPSGSRAQADWIPCALVEWFSQVGDKPDEDTGLWIVEPDLETDGSHAKDVIHIQTLLRAAHLIPVFGESLTPSQLKQHEVLDSYQAFYVNKYADYHAHDIAF